MITNSKTRRFILIKIENSSKKLIPERIISSAKENFRCKNIVIAKRLGQKEGLDYLIGLHTEDASKNTFRKKINKMFSEFLNFNFCIPPAKKGLGGWARALCSDNFKIIYCSGELDKKELQYIGLQNKKKKRIMIIKPKKKEDCKCKKSKETPKEEGCKKSEEAQKEEKPLFFFFSPLLHKGSLLMLKHLKSLLLLIVKEISILVKRLLIRALLRLDTLVVTYFFLLYVFYYKGGAYLTPEIVQSRTPEEILSWLLDWREKGLPPGWTESQEPANVKELYVQIKRLISWIFSFFKK